MYAFSTENWKRSFAEVSGIFKLLVTYVNSDLKELVENNVKVKVLGDYHMLPKDAVNSLERTLAETKNNTGLQFNIALNNGGRDEIKRDVYKRQKYVNIAKNFYGGRNRDIEIIKLNGSIELAPILGLSDVIVDIVETGNTLRENHLSVIEEFENISARFIANKTSFKFENEIISHMLNELGEQVK